MPTPIVIVGPTASGKTDYAIKLAGEQSEPVDILVVDSKQVYRGQDIVTGKDKNKFQVSSFKFQIFGVDLVDPDERWSVAQFIEYATKVISDSQRKDHQLIIVVGTPQYFLSLIDTPESVNVKPDSALRYALQNFSVDQLQERVKKVNPKRFADMNNSDRYNPRRLIRAIEISSHQSLVTSHNSRLLENPKWIGMTIGRGELERRIRARVVKRLEQGAVEEYEELLKSYPNWTPEAKSALGYKEIEGFVNGEYDGKKLIDLWTTHEIQYAKRQMTWWKDRSEIHWIDCYNEDHEKPSY